MKLSNLFQWAMSGSTAVVAFTEGIGDALDALANGSTYFTAGWEIGIGALTAAFLFTTVKAGMENTIGKLSVPVIGDSSAPVTEFFQVLNNSVITQAATRQSAHHRPG